ncbi:MAG: hypothetical protein RMI56_06685 [Sulfolobales archaeon]|nr:hypothetical protein [Sulfolobales archaeon]MDW8083461.1 hypothetical protein [Sulfolobales archaeon]
MGKYRKYGRRRTPSKRRSKEILIVSSVVLSLLHISLAMYVSIPISKDILEISLNGLRAVNATLFRVTYLDAMSKSSLVRLQIDNVAVDFDIPEGRSGTVWTSKLSRLVRVNQEVVQPKITVSTLGSIVTYPAPPINTSTIGRSEDYILSHYPLELYFVFITQLCNSTIHIKSDIALVNEATLIYRLTEEGYNMDMPLLCRGGICEGFLENKCVVFYDVTSDLSYLNFFRVKYRNGEATLRFIDNLWIPVVMYIAVMSGLFLVYRKTSAVRGRTRSRASI